MADGINESVNKLRDRYQVRYAGIFTYELLNNA